MTGRRTQSGTSILLSILVHAAAGMLFWSSLPSADGAQPAPKSDERSETVVEMLSLDHAERSEAAPATVPREQASLRQIPQTRVRPPGGSSAPEKLPDTKLIDKTAGGSGDAGSLPAQNMEVTSSAGVQSRRATSNLAGSTASHYRDLLLAHIGRYRHYPLDAQRDGVEGTAWIRFLLSRNGRLVQVWLENSSGQIVLDREAAAAVRRAEPLPPIPSELPDRLDITLPIDFNLAPSAEHLAGPRSGANDDASVPVNAH